MYITFLVYAYAEEHLANRTADTKVGDTQLAVGEAGTPQIHASHFKTVLCFVGGHDLAGPSPRTAVV